MEKKQTDSGDERSTPNFKQAPVQSDFYSSAPTERPLHQDRIDNDSVRVRKTGRHQAAAGKRKETADPREKQALLAILKAGILILLLIIVFFLLWKSISIYEERMFMESQVAQETSPVLQQQATLVEEFHINDQEARQMFAERVEAWKEAERLVRSARGLVSRNNLDQAIARCQDALRVEPSHLEALELLGQLYFEKGMFVESINSYMRMLSIDPSQSDLQEQLIKALDAYGDAPAVIYMSQWYLEENNYAANVQRYLANAYYNQEEFDKAAEAYNRVLNDVPNDVNAREKQAQSYMQLSEWELALASLDQLREINYRDAAYYHDIAICHAQLGHSQETVQTLGKAAHLFGQNVVVGWVQDPQLDPIREDRTFQAFAERVGGEEFRKWLEKVATSMEADERKDITPQLKMPEKGSLDQELLSPNR